MSLATHDDAGEVRFAEEACASPEQMREVRRYRQLVLEWDARFNLVGPSVREAFWVRHALDSAQLFHVERPAVRWADIGAGAGFPGILLAILLKSQAGAEVHLVESMAKRAAFLRMVCDELALPAVVHHARAEALTPLPRVDIVTARACAPLPKLFEFTERFFRKGAAGLFLKGQAAAAEVEAARADWSFDAELIASRTDPSGRIVRVRNVVRNG